MSAAASPFAYEDELAEVAVAAGEPDDVARPRQVGEVTPRRGVLFERPSDARGERLLGYQPKIGSPVESESVLA